MNGLNHDAVLQLQKEYPTGTRILLLHMEQDPWPIPDNTKGTVWHVDDIGHNAEFSIMLLFIKKPPAFNNF